MEQVLEDSSSRVQNPRVAPTVHVHRLGLFGYHVLAIFWPRNMISNRANVLKTELYAFHHRLRWIASEKELARTAQLKEEQNLCLSIVLDLICIQLAVSHSTILLQVDLLGIFESLK
jgi:hypothetical protein